jgi:hypothetical protein
MGGQSPANDAKNLLVNGWTQIYTRTYNDIYGKGNPFCDQKRGENRSRLFEKIAGASTFALTTHPFLWILLLHA